MAFELVDRGVEVLGVAGVGDPERGRVAEDAGEPEDAGGEEVLALVSGGVVEDEDVAFGGVVARGDGDGLAVAGLDELELALVHGFADGVVDEAFGEGLLERGDDLGEGLGEGGGNLGHERRRFAGFEADFAVDDVGVGAGGGLVEGPGEVRKAQGQAEQREVAVGARVAEAAGGFGEIGGELGGEFGIGDEEVVGELEGLVAGGGRRGARRRSAWWGCR